VDRFRSPARMFVALAPPRRFRCTSSALGCLPQRQGSRMGRRCATNAQRQSVPGSSRTATTCNKQLAALQGVLRQSWRLGYTPAEEVRGLLTCRPSTRGRAHAASALQDLLEECGPANVRVVTPPSPQVDISLGLVALDHSHATGKRCSTSAKPDAL
jgi:hypothetical protein